MHRRRTTIFLAALCLFGFRFDGEVQAQGLAAELDAKEREARDTELVTAYWKLPEVNRTCGPVRSFALVQDAVAAYIANRKLDERHGFLRIYVMEGAKSELGKLRGLSGAALDRAFCQSVRQQYDELAQRHGIRLIDWSGGP